MWAPDVKCNLWETACPEPELIRPCVCQRSGDSEGQEIACGGDSPLDLPAVFRAIAATNRTAGQKHFRKLIISNTALREVPARAFAGVHFDEYAIHDCTNLTRIHRLAFATTNSTGNHTGNTGLSDNMKTYGLFITNNPKLNGQSTGEYSLFDALTQLPHLQTLVLADNNITEIPALLFNGSTARTVANVEIAGQSIESVSDRSFYNLQSLYSLRVTNTSVRQLSTDTFAVNRGVGSPATHFPMHIYLYNNRYINSGSFAADSVSTNRTGRPIVLSILDDTRELFSYIPESVFRGVVSGNVNNKLFLLQIQLDCNDCRNKWLTNRNVTTGRLLYLECANGRPFDSKFIKSDGVCGDGWDVYHDDLNDVCYKYFSDSLDDYQTMVNLCHKQQNSSLPTIKSKAEQNFLINLIVKYNITDNVWLDAGVKHNHIVWADSSSGVEYEFWMAGHSVIDSNCVIMTTGAANMSGAEPPPLPPPPSPVLPILNTK
ncbi:unnamed protein product [Medioppia subpectinata]|uniref:C-type lectin domain-containing protein n=1 Tax=Medioppia subpectinata TaxID=1979941 RepID=A0A7R9KAT7_9ACAR|nr:unnamed protein product [Medioppia subpectinata]CAG2100058.1 unnamed protein product [Medioppia subpectinata]